MANRDSKTNGTERVEQGQKLRTSRLALWSFVLGVYLYIICLLIAIMSPCLAIPPRLYSATILCFISLFFLCYIGSLLLGIISIFIIKRHKDELKGIRLAVAGIALNGILTATIITITVTVVRPTFHRVACGLNMEGLGKAMECYAEEFDGKYPTTDKWCDLLVKYEVTENTFRCIGNQKERCSYAMNPNCEPNSPGDMVFLFESKGGWNQFGGPEILTFENHKPKGCNVLFNGGQVKFVKPEQVGKLKWKAEEDKKWF